jgi:hypothetical protein
MMLENNYKGICDHCGEVGRALMLWSVEDTRDCPCLCHKAEQGANEKKVRRKKR